MFKVEEIDGNEMEENIHKPLKCHLQYKCHLNVILIFHFESSGNFIFDLFFLLIFFDSVPYPVIILSSPDRLVLQAIVQLHPKAA